MKNLNYGVIISAVSPLFSDILSHPIESSPSSGSGLSQFSKVSLRLEPGWIEHGTERNFNPNPMFKLKRGTMVSVQIIITDIKLDFALVLVRPPIVHMK
jgi:hypothetical protein